MNIYRSVRKFLRPVKRNFIEYTIRKQSLLSIKEINENQNINRIFYLGITENNNLGDNAQYYCTQLWIKKHYPTYKVFYINASMINERKHLWLSFFIKNFSLKNDLIIFQSGYNTQDHGYNLGCNMLRNHELMHRLILDNLPEAKILMLPQTVYFQTEKYKKRTSESYNKCHNMLFLARDEVSYRISLEMFPHINVKLYPDIVTTLIGKFIYKNERKGIFLCTRNDSEKFYDDKDLDNLFIKLSEKHIVRRGDTQSSVSGSEIRRQLKIHILQEIERLSKYQVVITDRYHGTIFALCAGTPVIIIKTNDHKVTTGATWFKGIYDNHVYLAKDLEDAYYKAMDICRNFEYTSLEPYFEKEYYDKLPQLFEEISGY